MFSSISMKHIYLPLYCSIIIVSKVHIVLYVCTNINEHANKTSYYIEENVGRKKTLVNCWQIAKVFSLKFVIFNIYLSLFTKLFSSKKSKWLNSPMFYPAIVYHYTVFVCELCNLYYTKQNPLDAKVRQIWGSIK